MDHGQDPITQQADYIRNFEQQFDARSLVLPAGFDPIALGRLAQNQKRSEASRRASFALQLAGRSIITAVQNHAFDALMLDVSNGPYGLLLSRSTDQTASMAYVDNAASANTWRQSLVPLQQGFSSLLSSKAFAIAIGKSFKNAVRNAGYRTFPDLAVGEQQRKTLQAFVLAGEEMNRAYNPQESLSVEEVAEADASALGFRAANDQVLTGTNHLARLVSAIPELPHDAAMEMDVREAMSTAFNSFYRVVTPQTGFHDSMIGLGNLDALLRRSNGPGAALAIGQHRGRTAAGPRQGATPPEIELEIDGKRVRNTAMEIHRTSTPNDAVPHMGCVGTHISSGDPLHPELGKRSTYLSRLYVHILRIAVAEGRYGDVSGLPDRERSALSGALTGPHALQAEVKVTAALLAQARFAPPPRLGPSLV